jgi:hypothetical protein
LSREIEERSLAHLWREGNAARQIPSWRGDDALLVIKSLLFFDEVLSFSLEAEYGY